MALRLIYRLQRIIVPHKQITCCAVNIHNTLWMLNSMKFLYLPTSPFSSPFLIPLPLLPTWPPLLTHTSPTRLSPFPCSHFISLPTPTSSLPIPMLPLRPSTHSHLHFVPLRLAPSHMIPYAISRWGWSDIHLTYILFWYSLLTPLSET